MAKKSKTPIETVTVYRIELEDGTGVYRSSKGNLWNKITDSMVDFSCHPRPQEDPVLNYDELFDVKFSFGFSSIEQYKNWFFNPYWRKELSKYGVFLSLYEVDKEHFRNGQKQIIFRKDHAVLKERINPFHFK